MDLPKTVAYKIIVMGGEPDSLAALSETGEFDVRRADTLNQLAEMIKPGMPDILCLAMDLEAFDPFLLCARLSKARVAVLMLSEAPTRETLIKAARHGAADVLVLPSQPGTLLSKVDRALVKAGRKAPAEGLGRKMDFGFSKSPYDKMKVLIKNVSEVLALPFAVVKIIGICNDPKASAKALEKPVTSDPAIAAMIMQRASSAAFAGVGRTTSIERAIMKIGIRATRNIAASFSVFKLFSRDEKTFGFNRIWFWIHSLTTGICAHNLATLLRYPQPEDAFLAGLLHDIGKMVLDDFLNEEFGNVLRMANEEAIPIRLAEQSVFEIDHSYVGSKIASSWGFPSVIAEGIARHHLYASLAEKPEEPSIGAIVCLANQMAKAMMAGSGGDDFAEREVLPLWRRLPKGVPWRKIMEKVFEEIKAYTEILEIPPEQFEMELPQEQRGKAGIYLPKSAGYGPLLEIALSRQGFEPELFSTLENQNLKEKGVVLVVADLSSVSNDEEVARLQKGVTSLLEKNIILPRTDEKNRPFSLGFFWLESQLKQLTDHL